MSNDKHNNEIKGYLSYYDKSMSDVDFTNRATELTYNKDKKMYIDAKYIKGTIKKYVLFFPIILFFTVLAAIFKELFALIGVYFSFEYTYLYKKTFKIIIIDNLVRLLAFFIAYGVTCLIIK